MQLENFPPSPNGNTTANKTTATNSHIRQGMAHTHLIGSGTFGDADTIGESVSMTYLNTSMLNTSGQLPAMFTDGCCYLNPQFTGCRTATRCTSDNRIASIRIQRQFSDIPAVSNTLSASEVRHCFPTHSTSSPTRQLYYDESSNSHPSTLQDYRKFYQSFGLLSAFTQLLLPKHVPCLEDPLNVKIVESPKLQHFGVHPVSPAAIPSLGPTRSQAAGSQQHQCNKTIVDEQLYVRLNPDLPDDVPEVYGRQIEDYNCAGGNNDLLNLRAFAGKFKQRRMKLGITQAEVGRALGRLKLGGFGCLSQSTICRFESLTLSQNNMLVLKPILQTWLDQVEQVRYSVLRNSDGTCYGTDGSVFQDSIGVDRRRRRTSITDPEKRMLEAYFRAQPKPSAEELGAIANRIKLKKNVVRVWFCNQRQKHKRLHLKQYASISTV
ncbi:POU domain transcription factor, class 4 [Paragonimus westermani]|uniref:POU domain protein n=1 Tax=Paragonimus westermani TaxID=34504 RepID=A0A5J4NBJ0_9TREM|nr:POU domain transcription factor, class 4 [Paragonimus westermani]